VSDVREPGARLRPSDDVVARRLDDVVVLINLATNRMFELNATGARVWELISAGATLEEVRDAMLREFDVTEADLRAATDSLTGWLTAEGLLERGHVD
jgi:coenzyme PQQ synthesis protein D (PqqD)